MKKWKMCFCGFLVFAILANQSIVMAAQITKATYPEQGSYSVGQTYTKIKTLTLTQIDDIAEEIYDEQNSSIFTVASAIIGLVPGLSTIYNCYAFGTGISTTKEYKFYSGIRSKMIKRITRRLKSFIMKNIAKIQHVVRHFIILQ